MKPPHYDMVRDLALTTDELLLERVRVLLDDGYRRQLWLMFLDERSRQMPLIMPTDIPRRPRPGDTVGFGEFLRALNDDVEAATIVVTLERRGSDTITEIDAEWLRLVRDSCAYAQIPARGPLLCHSRGVRWVAAEDYAIG